MSLLSSPKAVPVARSPFHPAIPYATGAVGRISPDKRALLPPFTSALSQRSIPVAMPTYREQSHRTPRDSSWTPLQT